MKVIQKGFELSKKDYYKTHLKIVNAILPVNMTEKEIEILSEFLSLPEETIKGNMFNSFARKKVIEVLNLTKSGISNYINGMVKKGYIKKEGDNLSITPALLPDGICQGYNFKLKMKE